LCVPEGVLGGTATSDGLAQALPHTEADASPGGDGDRLAGVGVAPDARTTLLDLEGPEARDRHRAILPKPLLDSSQDRIHDASGPGPGGPEVFADLGDQLAFVHEAGFCYAFLRRVAFFLVAFFRVPLRLVAFLPAFLEAFRFVFFFAFFVAI